MHRVLWLLLMYYCRERMFLIRKAKERRYPTPRATVWIKDELMKHTQVAGMKAVIEYP